MINVDLLKTICETPGAPGFEDRVRSLVLKEIKAFTDDIEIDNMGNIIALKKGKSNQKSVMIEPVWMKLALYYACGHQWVSKISYPWCFDPTLTSQSNCTWQKDFVHGFQPIHVMTPEAKNKVPKLQIITLTWAYQKKKLTS